LPRRKHLTTYISDKNIEDNVHIEPQIIKKGDRQLRDADLKQKRPLTEINNTPQWTRMPNTYCPT
jgi:hypothetical protein